MQTEENRIETIITHEGTFHADEVFATAILKDLFPDSMELKAGGKVDFVKYLRTRDPKTVSQSLQSDSVMVIDTGGEDNPEKFNYDHHQVQGAGQRENGVKYATAGLIWEQYGKEWIKYVDVYFRHKRKDRREIGEEGWIEDIDKKSVTASLNEEEIDLIWSSIDEKYVQLIDSRDTGQLQDMTMTLEGGTELPGEQFTLAEVVRLYNIDTYDGKKPQQRFDEAVEVFRTLLFSMVNKYMDLVSGIRKFNPEKAKFLSNGRAVIINQKLNPVVTSYLVDKKEGFENVEYFAVLNAKDGYSIMVAPVREGMRQYRNPQMIPEELRLGNDVAEVNKRIGSEDGVTFSHTKGFFASCKDIKTAEKFLEYCTNQNKN